MSITSKFKRSIIILSLPIIAVIASCTPEEIAIYNTLSPAEKEAVNRHLREKSSGDCYSAIDRYWPGDKARARQVVWRESRNIPTAANTRSSARGCFQLLHSLHAHRYTAVGCSTSDWGNASCNVRAAAHLYHAAGWQPWALTA